jgi:Xaa-Pro aminopeptidase
MKGKIDSKPDMDSSIRHHASYVPSLSLEERDRRWELLRKRMLVDGLDCLFLYGNNIKWGMGMVNVRYVTHIGCGAGAFAVFPIVGEPVIWTDLAHQHIPSHRYLHTQNWIKDIRPDKGPGPVVEYLKEKNYAKSNIGLVGYSAGIMSGDIIPATVIDCLHKQLPEANFINATGLVNYYRLIKSMEEISFLEKAGEIARKVIDKMVQSAEPGKKECELFADMVHTQISNQAEPEIFIMFTSGPVDGPGNDKQLLHGAHYPAIPTTRELEKGDLILMEFHMSYGGYLAAAEFSLYLGKAPKELRRIHEVSVQCFEHLRDTMKPGVTFREAIEAERKPCEKAGMDYIELGFHQHGLGSAGPLTMVYKSGDEGLSGDKISELIIQENMVFGTNIDIHDPRWKPDVGIMLGDTLHVTSDSARCLVNTPLNFFEKKV